jgi:transaldolase
MPENTLVASSRIENLPQALYENSIEFEQSRSHMEELATLGIEINEVGELLEEEGLSKFVTPWVGLHNQVRELISL